MKTLKYKLGTAMVQQGGNNEATKRIIRLRGVRMANEDEQAHRLTHKDISAAEGEKVFRLEIEPGKILVLRGFITFNALCEYEKAIEGKKSFREAFIVMVESLNRSEDVDLDILKNVPEEKIIELGKLYLESSQELKEFYNQTSKDIDFYERFNEALKRYKQKLFRSVSSSMDQIGASIGKSISSFGQIGSSIGKVALRISNLNELLEKNTTLHAKKPYNENESNKEDSLSKRLGYNSHPFKAPLIESPAIETNLLLKKLNQKEDLNILAQKEISGIFNENLILQKALLDQIQKGSNQNKFIIFLTIILVILTSVIIIIMM